MRGHRDDQDGEKVPSNVKFAFKRQCRAIALEGPAIEDRKGRRRG